VAGNRTVAAKSASPTATDMAILLTVTLPDSIISAAGRMFAILCGHSSHFFARVRRNWDLPNEWEY